jgi:hypothetical protein
LNCLGTMTYCFVYKPKGHLRVYVSGTVKVRSRSVHHLVTVRSWLGHDLVMVKSRLCHCQFTVTTFFAYELQHLDVPIQTFMTQGDELGSGKVLKNFSS